MKKHHTVKKLVQQHLAEIEHNNADEVDMCKLPSDSDTSLCCSSAGDVCCGSSIADGSSHSDCIASSVCDEFVDYMDESDTDTPLSDCLDDFMPSGMEEDQSDDHGNYVTSDSLPADHGIASELIKWSVKHNVKQSALKELLQILRKHHKLPKDPRTLLRTVRRTSDMGIRSMKGSDGHEGEYVYFGVENELKKILEVDYPEPSDVPDVISLLFNVDGLPLYKSCAKQFWPILGKVYNQNIMSRVFTIAIFCGTSKPDSVQEYLHDFVNELCCLKQVGVTFHHKHLSIEISGFSCDAPARAFVKCIKGHTGYFGCEKCTQRGKYVDGRLTYPEIDAEKRTGMSFNAQVQEEHHKGVSPLVALGIDLVNGFPLDYMHMVCLGVTRKLILNWMRGAHEIRISSAQIKVCCERLAQFTPCVCSEFNRKPRSLYEIDRWKAVELRNFLVYYGPLALRSVVPDDLYHHFMLLSVAIIILSSSTLCSDMHGFAAKLLHTFVAEIAAFYGKSALIYNVHNLTHLADDVARFGVLDTFSCFQFENKLGCIKRQLRSGAKPLAQFCHRKSEVDVAKSVEKSSSIASQNSECIADISEPPVTFSVSGMSFDIRKPADCYALTTNSDIVKIQNISRNTSGEIRLHCRKFSVSDSFFTYPCSSVDMHIMKVSKLSSSRHIYHPWHIQSKCMLLPWKSCHVAFPLLHI